VRQRLLDTAAELIAERGWTAVSKRLVAERAGVAAGLVHYHFTSVQALLSAAAVGVMRQAPGPRIMRPDLDRHEQVWRPVAEEKQLAGRRATRWFLPHSATRLHLRRVMMALAQLPGLGRVLTGSLGGKQTAIMKRV